MEFAKCVADVVIYMADGVIEEMGTPEEVFGNPKSEKTKASLIEAWKGPLIRFYFGTDLVGSEIGAAAKNVIGIAAGVLDGIGMSSLKGALMSRGTREISRLIAACGGNPFSAYGLCHLGDYEATVFSKYSHNRTFGECFAKGEAFSYLAEGYYTVKALVKMAEERKVDLPICEAIYRMLYEGLAIKEGMENLFNRSLKQEF
jgi:glycerol-3-phosphate dehydrogenase (NAD(P)+)